MSKSISQFNKQNFNRLCNKLAKNDEQLQSILNRFGYPPMWSRTPSFASLIHIILEQQVSLASAKAAFDKLKATTGRITAKKILQLTDAEMRACYFSRQKTIYARELANAILTKKIDLKKLSHMPDEEIRQQLKTVKGIGDWTVDVYLLFCLQRTDVFPTGDLAMMNAFKQLKAIPKTSTKERIVEMAEAWRPHRSVATMLLWHHYIKTRNIKI